MNPEEMNEAFTQMFAIQRQIQESQIKNTDAIARLEDNLSRLETQVQSNTENIDVLVREVAKLTVDQREKFNQFYGYHMSADSERLDIITRLRQVEQEVANLKQKLDGQEN